MPPELYEVLAMSVIGQQRSVDSAAAIRHRLITTEGERGVAYGCEYSALLAGYLSDLGHLEEARVFAVEAAEIAMPGTVYTDYGLMINVFDALIKATDHARVKMLIEKMEHRTRISGNRVGLSIVLYGRGVLALEQGDPDDTVAACEEALQYTARSFPSAWLYRVLGAALAKRGGPGDVDRAQVAYGEALAIFENMEARRRAEQVRAELARLKPG